MIGWALESRGPESIETAVDGARKSLQDRGDTTARHEIHEALRDLSRRPEPDLTGAIQHAMAALDCTSREAVGDPRATLGQILKRFPDLTPKPLHEAVTKMWGYVCENARNLREGQSPDRPEAELIVGACSTAISYIVSKIED